MEHSFDVDVAQKYGVEAAIIIRHFQFWILKNRAEYKHQYDSRTWTYASVRALAELWPYWTARQICRTLDRLIETKVLCKGNYNQTTYDRTLWYAFADEKAFLSGKNGISPNGKMDLAKRPNRIGRTGAPIPIQSPNTSADNNKVERNPQAVLELDCRIAQESKFLAGQLQQIFHPGERSRKTFANIIHYFVNSSQRDARKICWFKDAAEWARIARVDGRKAGGKALFVQTVKERTGYGANPRLLCGKTLQDSHTRPVGKDAKSC